VGWHVVLVQNPPISPQFQSFPSHTFMQFRQAFNIILLIYHLAAGYPLCYHSTLNIKENNQHGPELRTTHACLFGLGDDAEFHCIDCRLVSGPYVNTQVSSQVIIEFNKSGSSSVHCKRSKHISLQHSFCSSHSSFGTIFAQTLLMFNSSLRIHRTLSLSIFTSSATAQTPNLQFF